MTCSDDVRTCIAEELLYTLCKIADRGSISLLDEKVSGICVIKCETDKIDSLVKIHKESGHFGICDRYRVAGLDLVDKERDN